MARRRGVQEPSFALVPKHAQSEGGEACALAAGYDMKPDKWQRIVLEGWLATDSKLQWAASDCGCAVPRQNGKNAILEFTELYLAAILGMKILHTAHEVKTCRKHFLRMKYYFENARKFPELAELVTYIRATNGQEAIVLKNGGSIEFIARSKSSGRGFTVDVLVCDEQLREVPPGETGELLMSGSQLTLGYFRDEEKTKAAFVVPPGQDRVFYRTGDRVRRRDIGQFLANQAVHLRHTERFGILRRFFHPRRKFGRPRRIHGDPPVAARPVASRQIKQDDFLIGGFQYFLQFFDGILIREHEFDRFESGFRRGGESLQESYFLKHHAQIG